MLIEVAAKEYLVEIEVRKFSQKTIKSYRINLNLFIRYCKDIEGIEELDDLTLAIVRKFSLYMSGKGKKGSYIHSLLRLSSVF